MKQRISLSSPSSTGLSLFSGQTRRRPFFHPIINHQQTQTDESLTNKAMTTTQEEGPSAAIAAVAPEGHHSLSLLFISITLVSSS